MSKFTVDCEKLMTDAGKIAALADALEGVQGRIVNTAGNIENSNEFEEIRKLLETIAAGVGNEKSEADSYNQTLLKVIQNYQETECNIAGVKADSKSTDIDATSGEDSREEQNDHPSAEETDESFVDTINSIMEGIDNWFNSIEDISDKIKQAMADALDINGAVAIGISGDIKCIGGGTIGAQIVVDANGNYMIQIAPGVGASVGASADASVYTAVYPGLTDLSELNGVGYEAGGSAGEGVIGGLSALFNSAGESIGGLVSIGIGAEGTVAEAHTTVSYTFALESGNIVTSGIDNITQKWERVYNIWQGLYQIAN